MNEGRCHKHVPSLFDVESALNIENNVLIAIVSNNILLIKEDWQNWEFYPDIADFRAYKNQMRND
jgi:hypothetical protein